MPVDGVNVLGMFLEGCKWNPKIMSLDESDAKVLYSKCPMFLFRPSKVADFKKI